MKNNHMMQNQEYVHNNRSTLALCAPDNNKRSYYELLVIKIHTSLQITLNDYP